MTRANTSLIDLLTARGIPFVVRDDGRVFQIPAGGEGDDPPAETPPAETPPAQPPTQSYVTVDQFNAMVNQMQQGFQQALGTAIREIRAGATPAVTETEIPDVADEELDNAALEGKGVGRAVKRAIAAATARVRKDAEAAVGTVADFGTTALTEQALLLAKQGWTHYDRFKREIDAGIAGLPPEMRAQPSRLNLVYKMVLGDHYEELVKEEREAAIRQQRDTDATRPAPNKGGRADEVAPETVFAPDDLGTLRRHGKDIETIAKKLGKTPEQYLEGVRKYNQVLRGAA